MGVPGPSPRPLPDPPDSSGPSPPGLSTCPSNSSRGLQSPSMSIGKSGFFVHLDQKSGRFKTRVFTETRGIFPKTQGISNQIGVILTIIGRRLAKIDRIL